MTLTMEVFRSVSRSSCPPWTSAISKLTIRCILCTLPYLNHCPLYGSIRNLRNRSHSKFHHWAPLHWWYYRDWECFLWGSESKTLTFSKVLTLKVFLFSWGISKYTRCWKLDLIWVVLEFTTICVNWLGALILIFSLRNSDNRKII